MTESRNELLEDSLHLLRRRQAADDAPRARTQTVLIEAGVLGRVAEVAAEQHHCRAPLVIFDATTMGLFGAAVSESFRATPGIVPVFHSVPTPRPRCDDSTLSALRSAVRENFFDHVISVGSGTITDLAKFIAAERGVEQTAVATAPSMNGYTSAISAILRDDLKQTVRTAAPVTVIADLEVLESAPSRMHSAGAGDAFSRFIARSDWLLSHRLTHSVFDPDVSDLLERTTPLLFGLAERWNSRAAVADLTAALCITGIAQQSAHPGTQASGSEHLFSHYWDMLAGHPDFSHDADLHGLQVALGTLASAAIYEAVADTELQSLNPQSIRSRCTSLEEHQAIIEGHFRGLAQTVLRRSVPQHIGPSAVESRLTGWIKAGPNARHIAMPGWTQRAVLRQHLRACGAPTSFDALNISRSLADRTTRHCRHVRNRFTVLTYADIVLGASAMSEITLSALA